MINRRSFLSALAAAFVVDPERALWVPGKKLISIPVATREHRSTFLTVSVIGHAMLPVLHRNLSIARLVTRRYESQLVLNGFTQSQLGVPSRFYE